MAFSAAKMTKLSNLNAGSSSTANLPQIWHYKTTDTRSTVLAASYFDAHAKYLEAGDTIMVETAKGTHFITVAGVTLAGVVTTTLAGSGIKEAVGQAVTVAASDTIVSGLGVALTSVVLTMGEAPALGFAAVVADLGDQAGAPAAGSFYLKSYKSTGAGDCTPIAATVFGHKVNWSAKA